MFATVIVALVFLPLFMLGSVEAPAAAARLRLCGRSRGIAGSALTVTPVRCSYLLPRSKTVVAGGEPALTQRLKTRCERFLGRVLHYWRLCWSSPRPFSSRRLPPPSRPAGRSCPSSTKGPDDQLGHDRAQPHRLERARQRAGAAAPERSGSGVHSQAHRPCRTRRACAGSRIRRDRRQTADEGSSARHRRGRNPAETVAPARHEVTVGQPISIASTTCCRGHGPTSP